MLLGGQGWRSGESTRLPPVWPGFKSLRRRHTWVEFAVDSLPYCSERFFYGYSCFLLTSKINISKFQLDQESGRRRTTAWMCYLLIVIYLFIYLFVLIPLPMDDFFVCFNNGAILRFLLVSLTDWVKITVDGE